MSDMATRWRKIRNSDPKVDIERFFGPRVHDLNNTKPQRLQNSPQTLPSSTLVDRFGRMHRYLRISLTERCSLRCTYCMPAEGVQLTPDDGLMSREETLRLAESFVAAGVEKIRLTGGEPLLHRDAMSIVGELGSWVLDEERGLKSLAMTTNGLKLPRVASKLKEFGMTGVNISLDTMQESRFETLSRRPGHYVGRVLEAIDAATDAGFRDGVKVNCVVMRGVNDDEVSDFVDLARRGVHVRFIEFMPFSGNNWNKSIFTAKDILHNVETHLQTTVHQQPGLSSDTARTYRPSNDPSFLGSIGIIASMTQPFCGGCDRLRLTADGKLKTCLFGSLETDLLTPLRAGVPYDELFSSIIYPAVQKKHKQLGGHSTPESIASQNDGRPMTTIGG